MSVSLTRAEYWLLEAAVLDSVEICDLPRGEVAGRLNITNHDVSLEELQQALNRLARDGLIRAFDPTRVNRDFPLTVDLIRRELTETARLAAARDPITAAPSSWHPLQYSLTAEGGAAWEEFARPDWTCYLEGFGATIYGRSGMRGYGICMSRPIVEAYISSAHFLGMKVNASSVRWRIKRPWRASYWKSLPEANLACFRVLGYSDIDWAVPAHVMELKRWYRWKS